jgi:hypothetical protein
MGSGKRTRMPCKRRDSHLAPDVGLGRISKTEANTPNQRLVGILLVCFSNIDERDLTVRISRAAERSGVGWVRGLARPLDFIHMCGPIKTFGRYVAQVGERLLLAGVLIPHHLSD